MKIIVGERSHREDTPYLIHLNFTDEELDDLKGGRLTLAIENCDIMSKPVIVVKITKNPGD